MIGILLLLLTINRCGEGCDDPAPPLDTGEPEPACTIEVDETTPTQGAADADWRAPIEFYLSNPDPSATIETDVPGTLEVDGRHVIWRPDAPLTPLATYTFTLHFACGDVALEFTVSDLGLPLEAAPAGEVYSLSLIDGRVVRPYGIGGMAVGYIDPLLLGLTAEGDALQIVEAFPLEDPYVQDTCLATNRLDMDLSGSPYIEGDDLPFQFFKGDDVRTRIYGARLTGTIAPDGSSIAGMTLSGQTRAEAWSGLADDVCSLAESFGEPCVVCDHDEAELCLPVYIDQLVAERVDTVPLVEVAEDCPAE